MQCMILLKILKKFFHFQILKRKNFLFIYEKIVQLFYCKFKPAIAVRQYCFSPMF